MTKYSEPTLKQAKGELERFIKRLGVDGKIIKAINIGIALIQQERDRLYDKRRKDESRRSEDSSINSKKTTN